MLKRRFAYLMEAEVGLDRVRCVEHFAVAREDEEEAVQRLRDRENEVPG